MISRRSALVLLMLLLVSTLTVLSVSSGKRLDRMSAFDDLPIPEELPKLYPVSKFSLIDSQGASFDNESLGDTVWVVDFVFTTCAGICPMMSSNMSDLAKAYENDPRVRFLSVSVNPETDTPEVLAQYAEKLGANPEQWRFVTGQPADIHRLAVEGFKLGSMDDPVMHSDKFALVDAQGYIRGYYDGTESEDCLRLARDIARLFEKS